MCYEDSVSQSERVVAGYVGGRSDCSQTQTKKCCVRIWDLSTMSPERANLMKTKNMGR